MHHMPFNHRLDVTMLLTAFFLGLQCLRVSGQVTFQQPVTNQVISGGVPFVVGCSDSTSAPHFSQMSNFSMLLLTGNYSSPQVLYAWDLGSTSPSTVANSITIPQSIGPSAKSAYFLGMSGWLSLNTSISVTYFSPRFTLQNMTGSSLSIPSSTSTATSSSTTSAATSAGRLIVCENDNGDLSEGETGGLGGIVNQACELAALAVISLLATVATSTIPTKTSAIMLATTSPPAMTEYAAQIAITSALTTSRIFAVSSSSPTLMSQAAASVAASNSGTASSLQSMKMVYCLVIAGLTLATVIALFWIWRRYRSNENYCGHLDCNHSNWRKKCDRVLRPVPRKNVVESDAEKGSALSPIIITSVISREVETNREAEIEAAAATRRQRFEEMMGNRASKRASQKTIMAELEGDLGFNAENFTAVPPMPPIPLDYESRDSVPDLDAKRKTMVGQGQQVTVVKGRDAAVIVRVGGKQGGPNHTSSSSRVISKQDLPPIPVHRTSDDEDTKYILSILYVKGDNDDDDDDQDGTTLVEKEEHEVEARANQEAARIRDMRKKKLRDKRSQLSIQIPTKQAVDSADKDLRTAP